VFQYLAESPQQPEYNLAMKNPPCRGHGVGHPGLELNPDKTAVCPECQQRLPAFLNEAGIVTFAVHYPPERKSRPRPLRSDRRR